MRLRSGHSITITVLLCHKQNYFPSLQMYFNGEISEKFSIMFFSILSKCFHSQEVLDLLGPLLTRQILELLVLLGFPEIKTGEVKETKMEWR